MHFLRLSGTPCHNPNFPNAYPGCNVSVLSLFLFFASSFSFFFSFFFLLSFVLFFYYFLIYLFIALIFINFFLRLGWPLMDQDIIIDKHFEYREPLFHSTNVVSKLKFLSLCFKGFVNNGRSVFYPTIIYRFLSFCFDFQAPFVSNSFCAPLFCVVQRWPCSLLSPFVVHRYPFYVIFSSINLDWSSQHRCCLRSWLSCNAKTEVEMCSWPMAYMKLLLLLKHIWVFIIGECNQMF